MQWLREWVEYPGTPESLAEQLTIAGLEVDSVELLGAEIENVVAATVETVAPHPQADRLRLCRVFDGSATHEIVCGAPNVSEGLIVPLARIGARLPGGRKIGASKLRGVRSEGMLCSGAELGIDDESDGLLVLEQTTIPGTSIVGLLGLNDAVIDIDLTPNRGDCFSVIGIAREIAARRQLPMKLPAFAPIAAQVGDIFSSHVLNAGACPRLCTRVIVGIDNKRPVPLWLRERLRRCGLRSISPIVDVTNYVMLELGQPLHAYDRASLHERIDVRFAARGESFALLNDRVLEPEEDVLVIADARGPIGLAGIMGGATTGVSESTTDIVFESAFFDPDVIAGRARRYGLHTDASVRFERGVDPENQARAIEHATALLQQIAGGTAGPVFVVEQPSSLPKRSPIVLSHARVDEVLGMEVEAQDVNDMLSALGMQTENTDGGWVVTPPGFRFDITIEEDLIEEVGRMIGYDRVPVIPAVNETHVGTRTESLVAPDVVLDTLVDRGYQEIVTYSFIDPELAELVSPGAGQLPLVNPISSDLAVMRRSLFPGLLATAKRNLANQIENFRLFEYGPQFAETGEQTNILAGIAVGQALPDSWDGDARGVDFFDVKRDIEVLLSLGRGPDSFRFEPGSHPALRPGQTAKLVKAGATVGWLGVLHPGIQKQLELRTGSILFEIEANALLESGVPKYSQYSRLPYIRRDVAFVVDESIAVAQLIDRVHQVAGPYLEDVVVFDVYRGKGIDATRKSIGLGLILQDASRTLTDADADKVVSSVTRDLGRELGATIRT